MLGDQEQELSQRAKRLEVGKWTVAPARNRIEHHGDAAKLELRAMGLLI
jgi:hypothetical protein